MDSPLVQAVILGFLQGLTEFLPVSSSGHLALAQQLIPGFHQPGVLLDVMLHVGTLAAVLAYFRRDLAGMAVLAARPGSEEHRVERKLIIGIIIASVPTAAIGLMLEDRVEWMFGSAVGVGLALIGTAAILVLGAMIERRVKSDSEAPGPVKSFMVGMAQGIAVTPGISRSGATISMARSLGVEGEMAARFSFLASLPAVAGAAVLTAARNAEAIASFTWQDMAAYVIGPLVAAATGYAAIGAVMKTVTRGRFVWFAPYCAILGGGAVIYGLVS